MTFSNAPQSFSDKPRAASQLTLTVQSPSLSDSVESGLLTPGNEALNDFILTFRRTQTNSVSELDVPVVVAVMGIGYVGIHLVQAFSKHYPVIAFDVSKERLDIVYSQVDPNSVYLTCSPFELTEATHTLIAVPTGIHENDRTIDKTHLQAAIDMLGKYARPGSTVVVESSVAVGMTRDLLTSLQEVKGLKAGMSPERVDPGRKDIIFEAIPKIVSGLDLSSLRSIKELYETVFDHVVPVSSCEVAEMTKLYENCQRMLCIAYVNEMADACKPLGIDPLEVCTAAATKPFGFQPFWPGPGVGGHCIPVNPFYLLSNMEFPLLKAATAKMWQRPAMLADKVMESLGVQHHSLQVSSHPFLCRKSSPDRQACILIVGVGFKAGQSAISHSPAIAMMKHLLNNYNNIYLEFADPLVPSSAFPLVQKMDERTDWNAVLIEEKFDAVIIVQAQWGLNLDVLSGLKTVQVHNFTSDACIPWIDMGQRHSVV